MKCRVGARSAQRQPSSKMVAAYHPPSKTTRAAIGRSASRVPKVRLGKAHEWLGRLQLVPAPEEGDFGILEPAIEPPVAGFGVYGGGAVLGLHNRR